MTEEEKPLFEPYLMNDLRLKNRVVMAPLTRSRAENIELEPTDLHATYYAQRASAGLIISEGIWISSSAVGWHDVPGIFTAEQVRKWRSVTDAVHRHGGRIFAQLWHTGSLSHPDFFDGQPPLAPSAINPMQVSPTVTGRKNTVTPREMTTEEVRQSVQDFASAAFNAMHAGFDGVQIQAGFHYLVNQFLNPRTNHRTDEYGGSLPNRARFLIEIIEAVGALIDIRRVGVKTGPAMSETGPFVSTDETIPTFDYVINRLNEYDLSHLLLMGQMADLAGTPASSLQGDGMFRRYREIFRGTVIGNVDFDQDRANRLISASMVDLVAFGRPFIANPDLPARLARDSELREPDRTTLYGNGARGYVDYPLLNESASTQN